MLSAEGATCVTERVFSWNRTHLCKKETRRNKVTMDGAEASWEFIPKEAQKALLLTQVPSFLERLQHKERTKLPGLAFISQSFKYRLYPLRGSEMRISTSSCTQRYTNATRGCRAARPSGRQPQKSPLFPLDPKNLRAHADPLASWEARK